MTLENVDLELVDTVDKAGELMRWLGERRPVLGFDLETTGLDREQDRIRLAQFGDTQKGWAIPWELWGGVALEVLKRWDGDIVGHNLRFDVGFTERYGKVRLERRRLHDTRLACHILHPDQPTGLKPNAARLVDRKAAYASDMLSEAFAKAGWDWATVPIDFEPYWAYGALDTVLTCHLYDKLMPQIHPEYTAVYELEMAVTWVLLEMEVRGMRVDVPYTEQKLEDLTAFQRNVESWCQSTYGISPGSNQKVAEKLIELGAALTKQTGTGGWALDEESITGILGGDYHDVEYESLDAAQQLAYQVLARRKAQKICSTYLTTLLEVRDENDRVHPRINQVGARTGRMSIERPALQTLPRGTVVRDCFIPDPGKVLFSADYDQIEVRLAAHWACDEAFTEAILGGDMHTTTARRVYDDETITKKDPRRQLAKNTLFARLYGAGAAKIALTAGVPVAQAQHFIDMYDHYYPGVSQMMSTITRTVEQRERDDGFGWVKTPLGRRLVIEGGKAYAGTNALIQGTAADVLKEALVRLDQAGVPGLLLPVHDEVIFEVNEDDAFEVADLVRKTMSDNRWSVPLTAGVDGPLLRWGAKYA